MATHKCPHESDINVLSAALPEIRENLKQISELLMSNAVLEEQALTMRNRVKEIDNRVRELEITVAHAKGKSAFTERVVWSLVCTALAGWKFIGG